MTESTNSPSNESSQNQPSIWNDKEAMRVLGQRVAGEEAAFMLGHLKPGMSLLDCGCGPGSITLGLASFVAPGEVRGIDLNPKLIEQAKAAAAEQGVANAQFEVGNAQSLPFDDDSFDIVFSHALMEHLHEPEVGLAQMKRVLKPGGIIAIRIPDWSGNLSYPDLNNLHRRLTSYTEQIFTHNGSDPYRGRRIGVMLSSQGFVDLRLTGSYTSFGTAGKISELARIVREFVLGPDRIAPLLASGSVTQAEIDQTKAEIDAWVQLPGALHLRAWVEAIARKP